MLKLSADTAKLLEHLTWRHCMCRAVAMSHDEIHVAVALQHRHGPYVTAFWTLYSYSQCLSQALDVFNDRHKCQDTCVYYYFS
jgi:hypothetical protein